MSKIKAVVTPVSVEVIRNMKVSKMARKIQADAPVLGNVRVFYKEALRLAHVIKGEEKYEQLPAPMKLYFAQTDKGLFFRNIKENKASDIPVERCFDEIELIQE